MDLMGYPLRARGDGLAHLATGTAPLGVEVEEHGLGAR